MKSIKGKSDHINMIFVGNGPPRDIPKILGKEVNLNHICLISNGETDYTVNQNFFYRDCVFGHLPFTEYTEKSLSGAMLESFGFQ